MEQIKSLNSREEVFMKKGAYGTMWGFMIAGFFVLFLPSQGTAAAVDCTSQSLQTAINTAAGGDTITVTGTCSENVVIGEGQNRLTLDGGGAAVLDGPNASNPTVIVRGREITVKGFTITGGLDGVQIYRGGTVTVDGNTIDGTGRYGISVVQNSYARIINNTIQNNPEEGILVSENSSARIGLLTFQDPAASPNIIQGNGGSGIQVLRSSVAIIVGNTIAGNTLDGIRVVRASQADIASNMINSNSENGILVVQNSMINLGNDTGTGIADLPNTTTPTAKNAKFALKCAIGGAMDGHFGTLKGIKGPVSAGSGCINSLIP
jgi:parallel beta-helix repeat protein